MNSNDALPFLKWAGGKWQLLNQFEELYPQKLKDGFITTYIEPFVGGGAVFFDLQKKYKFQKVLLNDVNEDLILAYKVIQSNCSELLISLKRLEEKYINLQSIELQSIMFYEIRNIFNKEKILISKQTLNYCIYYKLGTYETKTNLNTICKILFCE